MIVGSNDDGYYGVLQGSIVCSGMILISQVYPYLQPETTRPMASC